MSNDINKIDSRDENSAVSNKDRQFVINVADLPLYCPLPTSTLWDSHPRVYLPIDETPGYKIRCPYCGTQYILAN